MKIFHRCVLRRRKEITRYRCDIEASSQTSMEHAKISSFPQLLEVCKEFFSFLLLKLNNENSARMLSTSSAVIKKNFDHLTRKRSS